MLRIAGWMLAGLFGYFCAIFIKNDSFVIEAQQCLILLTIFIAYGFVCELNGHKE